MARRARIIPPAEIHNCSRCGSALDLKPLEVIEDKWLATLRPGHVWLTYRCRCGAGARRQVRRRS
jgi:hypothetical protein